MQWSEWPEVCLYQGQTADFLLVAKYQREVGALAFVHLWRDKPFLADFLSVRGISFEYQTHWLDLPVGLAAEGVCETELLLIETRTESRFRS